MKVNPFYLNTGHQGVFRLDTEDPSHPNQIVSICLRSPDISTMTRSVSLMEKMIEIYIKDQMPFVSIDGVQPILDEKMIQLACMIHTLQVEPKVGDDFDFYSFEELIGLFVTMPRAMIPIINKANELSEELAASTVNPTGASAMGQSESTSEKQAETQNMTEESQTISGQSMNDLVEETVKPFPD